MCGGGSGVRCWRCVVSRNDCDVCRSSVCFEAEASVSFCVCVLRCRHLVYFMTVSAIVVCV